MYDDGAITIASPLLASGTTGTQALMIAKIRLANWRKVAFCFIHGAELERVSWTISCRAVQHPQHLSVISSNHKRIEEVDLLVKRVPMGSPDLFMRTQALSSNLM